MSKLAKYLSTVLVVLLISISVQAFNDVPPELTFKKESPNTILLKVGALYNPIQVVLQNNEGELLFTETLVKGYRYKKKYDISDFSDGIYYMKIVEATNVQFFKIEKGAENTIEQIEKLPFE